MIAISSTAAGGTVSRIVPLLDEGAPVTTSRTDVDYIVTEYGIAHLRGKNLKERAKALIDIAHPQFREGLAEEYEKRFHCNYAGGEQYFFTQIASMQSICKTNKYAN